MPKKKIVKKEIVKEEKVEEPTKPTINEELVKLEAMIELMNHFGIAIEPKVYMKLEEERKNQIELNK
jgi:hypothetical protein